MLINVGEDNRQPPNVIFLHHRLEEESEKRKKRGEREGGTRSVMKLDLIPYLFISLPASLLELILMKRPQMTSFRVKLIGFGPTRLHFLPGYFPVFPSSFIHTEKGSWGCRGVGTGEGGAEYERKQRLRR